MRTVLSKLFLFLILFLIEQNILSANEQKNILILHSYSQEYAWTKKQHEGFVNYLNENIKTASLEISTEHLDTKRVKFTKEYQDEFVKYLNIKYAEYKPDVIYVSDDNALTFMLNNQNSLSFSAPVVFSGINDTELKKVLDEREFSGVYEIKEIEQNIDLVKSFSPQTREIYFLGDNSETYNSIKSNIQTQILKYPNLKFKFISSKKLNEVKSELQKLPNRSFVLLTTIGAFEEDDAKNSTLNNSIERLSELKNIIFLSMEDAYIQHSVIGGYVTDGIKQGSLTAQRAYTILKTVPMQKADNLTNDSNTYIFNRKALLDAKLFLPEYISREALILNENATFYVKYQKYIINTFFVFLTTILIALILIYFISREKKHKLQRNIAKLKISKHNLIKNRKILHNIQNITNAIYWEYDIKNSAVFILNCTNIKIDIESENIIYYDSFFNILIHPSDFYQLKYIIEETVALGNTSTCNHRLLLKDGSFVKVINTMLFVKSNSDEKIVGLIQVNQSKE